MDQSRANRTLVETEIERPSMLVIAECWHPGWSARVDGQEVAVHRVNYLQQGVWLEPGKHTVELLFFPQSLRSGLIVSLVTAVFLLVVVVVVVYEARRKDAKVLGEPTSA